MVLRNVGELSTDLNRLTNITVLWRTFMLHIREVPSSNLDPEPGN
jgi:hypothetical protein